MKLYDILSSTDACKKFPPFIADLYMLLLFTKIGKPRDARRMTSQFNDNVDKYPIQLNGESVKLNDLKVLSNAFSNEYNQSRKLFTEYLEAG